MVDIVLEGRHLLSGKAEFGFEMDLWETDNEQYILVFGAGSSGRAHVTVAQTYDFDYRGLVEELNEELISIDYLDFDMADLVQDWKECDCDVSILEALVTVYFRQLIREDDYE